MKIGVFDSGLGGILILKALATELPEYDYEYYGDTANLPYGDKTEREIYEFTKAGVEHLFERDCALVLVACNTASSETLRRLQHDWLPGSYPDRKVLGVIVPMVEAFITSDCSRAKLIATTRTVSSGKYHLELGKHNEFDKKIEAVATPALVPLLEAGDSNKALEVVVAEISTQVEAGEIEGLLLGCTHYCLLKELLREKFGSKLKIFSQDEIIPQKLKEYLEKHPEITEELDSTNYRNVYLTKHRGDYDQVLKSFLQGQFIGE